MTCDEALRVQAYLDGELDAASALSVEMHLATCQDCQALRRSIEGIRAALRTDLTYHRADSAFRGRIARVLDPETAKVGQLPGVSRRRWAYRFWAGAFTGSLTTAAAAVITFFLVVPGPSDELLTDVVNAHLRSLMASHLVDVVSSDHHTVKPWFSAHTDVSPPVADFAREGYRLVGGRADYVDGHRASVVVYRHGAHLINVFAWTATGQRLPRLSTRNGYHVACWKSSDLDFCAVSDTALDELLHLRELLQAMTTPDSRE